jgi:CHAT domain
MMPETADSSAVDRRMALAREWDELVEQVRKLDGFRDFLKPPRLEQLLPAAEAGPVVTVNVSRWRCDALIVTTDGVEVKNLAGLTAESTSMRARDYLEGLGRVEEAVRLAYAAWERCQGADQTLEAIAVYTAAKVSLQDATDRCEETLHDLTRWLWDEIAEPVLTVLGVTGPPASGEPWPRLWWCPTGLLSLLPLHAAGHHRAEGRHESVIDRVVPSYTPTLRALLEARGKGTRSAGRPLPAEGGAEAASADSSRGRLLIVGLAHTPGQMPLPNVTRELRLLTEVFPGNHTILDGPAATWDGVRAQLPRHSWVHFSCHGDQNLADPSRGGILLYDRLLTIADISEGQYHGDFAFLSACKTATGGITLPDEAITLAAALHYTGYRHVIGTLWSIHDETAADVADAVYTDLTSAGTFEPVRAANALHTAIRGLRDTGKPLSQWMPFTHTGP